MYGELVPVGGGDNIPLLKPELLVGRREDCDIILRFSNISSKHCKLVLSQGYWYVQDLKSTNGVKVNGVRVLDRRIDPGVRISIAKQDFTLRYSPMALGAKCPLLMHKKNRFHTCICVKSIFCKLFHFNFSSCICTISLS